MAGVVKSMLQDDRGAAAVEYGLIVVAIAAVIILTVFFLGGYVEGTFSSACNAWKTAGTTSNTSAFSNC